MTDPRHRAQRGFTLIEIMIVVAIIGVLAAVIIPSWMKESRKGKFDPEVRAMFAEIALKEEQYKSEVGNGVYAALATCPATTSATGVDLLAQACYTGTWTTARIAPTEKNIRCTYAVTKGDSVTTGTSSPSVPGGSTFTTPSNAATFMSAWYYILATCDMDGAGGTNATFFTSSWDTSVQKMNYGS